MIFLYSAFYNILSFVQEKQPVSRASVLQQFGMSVYKDTEAAVNELISRGLLSCRPNKLHHLDQLSITPSGSELLEAEHVQHAEAAQRQADQKAAEAKRLEERHQDRADAERRYRTQNKIAVIMPVITFFLGVLAERFFPVSQVILFWLH